MRKEEYKYLVNEILKNNNTKNKNIDWFLNYLPISNINNSKNKVKIKEYLNLCFKERVYIDENYLYKNKNTFKIINHQ